MGNKAYLVFLRDVHWYLAILLAVCFWLIYGFLLQPFQPRNILLSLPLFILPVLIYPILEEIVFRGWLQGELYKKKALKRAVFGITLANVVTSLVFSAMHLINHSVIWALLIFFPSLVFGYFRDRYHQIIPSILLHVFYNAGFVSLFP